MKDWDTVKFYEYLPNLLLLPFIFDENARPTYPDGLHNRMSLLEVEHMVIEDAFRGLHYVPARLQIFLNDQRQLERNDYQFFFLGTKELIVTADTRVK